MNANPTTPRFPELDSVRSDLHRLKVMWIICCLSPLFYLFVARLISKAWFDFNTQQHGFLGLSDRNYVILAAIFGALAVALQGVIIFLRQRYAAEMRRTGRSAMLLLQIYMRRTIFLMGLSETTIFLGFILFLLNGDIRAIFVFGLIGLFYYAQSYPSEQGLGAFVRQG